MSKLCCMDGCGKRVYASRLCSMHYRRKAKHGDPNIVKKSQLHGMTVKERYDHYVVRSADGCWDWRGSKDKRGYAKLNIGGIPQLAHRLSWTFHCGPIPEGEQVLHRCDNPPCSNPAHLFLGSHQDNMDDMWVKGRARPRRHLGTEHGMSKMTEDQVYAIRESSGPSRIIAAEFGISGRQVRDIRTRQAWKHLPERERK